MVGASQNEMVMTAQGLLSTNAEITFEFFFLSRSSPRTLAKGLGLEPR